MRGGRSVFIGAWLDPPMFYHHLSITEDCSEAGIYQGCLRVRVGLQPPGKSLVHHRTNSKRQTTINTHFTTMNHEILSWLPASWAHSKHLFYRVTFDIQQLVFKGGPYLWTVKGNLQLDRTHVPRGRTWKQRANYLKLVEWKVSLKKRLWCCSRDLPFRTMVRKLAICLLRLQSHWHIR